MNTCFTCKYFQPDELKTLDGICLLSKTSNKFMRAGDDYREYDPFLEVSINFGCNRYEQKKS